MNETTSLTDADPWHDLLVRTGFKPENGVLGNEADFAAQLLQASQIVAGTAPSGTQVLVPLLDQGLIRASGQDATAFLQNLLTNDISSIAEGEARLAGFCTPKGRLLALFHIWRDAANAGDLLLMLPRELLPALLKKLSMYILRSKVKLSDATGDIALIGRATASGSDQIAVSPAPTSAQVQYLRFNCTDRPALSLIMAPRRALTANATALFAPGDAVSLPVWHWLRIAAGVPEVRLATSEAFVPQMLNMELMAVAGISFSKGCYPGQEIVARTQYLGKIKRRTYRAQLAAAAEVGAPVFAPETGEQPCGSLVSVAKAPTGHIEALVCVQSGAVEAGAVHVGAPDGPALSLLPLPYALDGPDTRKR